jgi:subtilisin family serine protease
MPSWLWAMPLAAALSSPAPAAPPAARLVVKYRPGVTATDSLSRLHRELGVQKARELFWRDGGSTGRSARYAAHLDAVRSRFPARSARARGIGTPPDLANVYVLELPAGTDVAAAAARYARDPNVEYAEPDAVARINLFLNDPFTSTSGSWGQAYDDLWGLDLIRAPLAWDTASGAGTVVAVVDTGVKDRHPDLRDQMWTNAGEIRNGLDDDSNGFVDDVAGWDFVRDNGRQRDQNGHGTHVAGTIGAAGGNGLGIAGVAYGTRLMALRGLDRNGEGFTSDLARAIVYAAENGADVINTSWGSPFPSAVVADAVRTARDLGVVVVFAAGNDNSQLIGDAAHPEVIAVAATDPMDARAGFSNWNDAISVAAPGVDILSTSGPNRVGGLRVRGGYRRLSGTSMAAPHVAGLAAVLLAAQPGLTPDEVRWHLELSAHQPGYPGWEGAAWNPYLGYGRIDATRVFDTPPITTRFRSRSIDFHGFVDDVVPLDLPADFFFTTQTPIAWTLGGSSWIMPSQPSGSGPATVPLGLDSTGLAPGVHQGSVTVSAPSAADGGASMSIVGALHADERVGGETLIAANVRYMWEAPHVAADGTNAVVFWVDGTRGAQFDLVAATIAPDGTMGPVTLLNGDNTLKDQPNIAAAFDGSNYLVAWREQDTEYVSGGVRETDLVRAVRLSPTLEVLDATPLELARRVVEAPELGTNMRHFGNVGVGFDGTAFTVLWQETDIITDVSDVYVRRVASNGVLGGAAVRLYPTSSTPNPQIAFPKIACTTGGTCLVAWVEYALETVGGQPVWVGHGIGIRLAGTQALDAAPLRLLDNVDLAGLDFPVALASDGTGFLLVATRNRCAPTSVCGFDAVATRVSAAGVATDPAGIRLNNPVGQTVPWVMLHGLTHDGTNYVATFIDETAVSLPPGTQPGDAGFLVGFPLFAARVGPNGAALDPDPVGLLVHAGATALSGQVASTSAGILAAWVDTRALDPSSKSVYAQRILGP